MTKREQIRPSNYKVNWLSLANPRQFTRINFNLFHYAGNNPVKYVDPDGRKVKNNSGITLIIKPEDSKDPYIRLPDGSTYDGEQDGIIFPDGTVYKTYGSSNFSVSVDEKGNYMVSGGTAFKIIGNIAKFFKNLNPLKKRHEDYYGKYKYEGKAKDENKRTFLNKWLEGDKSIDLDNDGKSDRKDFRIYDDTFPEKTPDWDRSIETKKNGDESL